MAQLQISEGEALYYEYTAAGDNAQTFVVRQCADRQYRDVDR